MRKFIAFDLGETLVNFDLNGRWYEWLNDEAIPAMYDRLDGKINKNQKGGLSLEKYQEIAYAVLAKQWKVNRLTPMEDRIKIYMEHLNIKFTDEIISLQVDAFYEMLLKYTTIFPESKEVLEKLHSEDYVLGLFSDTPWQSPGRLMEDLLQRFEIRNYFSETLYSGDISLRKPDPQVLEILRNKTDFAKNQMVYIGDREVDIKAAFNYDIPSIHINRIDKILEEDCPKPNYVIENLKELFDLLPDIE